MLGVASWMQKSLFPEWTGFFLAKTCPFFEAIFAVDFALNVLEQRRTALQRIALGRPCFFFILFLFLLYTLCTFITSELCFVYLFHRVISGDTCYMHAFHYFSPRQRFFAFLRQLSPSAPGPIMSPTPAWDPDVDSAAVLLAILCTVHARAPTPPHTPRATPAPAAAHEPPAERVTALPRQALPPCYPPPKPPAPERGSSNRLSFRSAGGETVLSAYRYVRAHRCAWSGVTGVRWT